MRQPPVADDVADAVPDAECSTDAVPDALDVAVAVPEPNLLTVPDPDAENAAVAVPAPESASVADPDAENEALAVPDPVWRTFAVPDALEVAEDVPNPVCRTLAVLDGADDTALDLPEAASLSFAEPDALAAALLVPDAEWVVPNGSDKTDTVLPDQLVTQTLLDVESTATPWGSELPAVYVPMCAPLLSRALIFVLPLLGTQTLCEVGLMAMDAGFVPTVYVPTRPPAESNTVTVPAVPFVIHTLCVV